MQKNTNEYYMDGIASRDRVVVEEIYESFYPQVRAFVLKNNGQDHDARDVFNLVIMQITARLEREKIEIRSTFEGYLFTACKNMWRRELKKIELRRVTSDNVRELYYVQQDMAQATLEQERWEFFHSKLADISDNCKEILQMFFNKLSSARIMEKMNYSSETTVRQRIFKCKNKLIEMIKSDPRFRELKDSD